MGHHDWVGKSLVNRFEWVGLLFTALLIYSKGKMLFENDDDEEDLYNKLVNRFAESMFPVTNRYMGNRLFVRGENARLISTPLMLVLVSIELSNIVFAVDSVPAVIGLSDDMFVIYTKNILAIVELKSRRWATVVGDGAVVSLSMVAVVCCGWRWRSEMASTQRRWAMTMGEHGRRDNVVHNRLPGGDRFRMSDVNKKANVEFGMLT